MSKRTASIVPVPCTREMAEWIRDANASPNRHEMVVVELPRGGGFVELDRGIADLIVELWRAGMVTLESCEGYAGSFPDGRAFIAFGSKKDARRFDRMVRRFGDTLLANWDWDAFGDCATVQFPIPELPEVTRRAKLYNRLGGREAAS